MATKAMNVKLEESKILDLKEIASIFHITMTDALNEALDAYFEKMKKDPFYRLSSNVKEASAEESEELISALESLSDEDLEISSVKRFTL